VPLRRDQAGGWSDWCRAVPMRGAGVPTPHRPGAHPPPALVHTGTMRRYGWFLGIGAVLLCVLAWIVVGRSLADDETKLGPPIVIPSATTTSEPSDEQTLEESKGPKSLSPRPAGSTNGDYTSSGSANGDSTGAERITPAPPRHAGDDEDDDDRDESDDADDDVDDDDAYDEDDDHDDAEDDDEDDDDD